MASTHFEKPTKMRGMLVAQALKNVKIALLLTGLAGFGQYLRGREHRRKCKEYYCNYDIQAVFKEMAAKGVFQSVVLEDSSSNDKDDKKKK